MIQRYSYQGEAMDWDNDGEFVYYSDHEAALAAERAKVRELVECLQDVVAFVGWGASVPEKVARVEALIEKYSKDEPNAE